MERCTMKKYIFLAVVAVIIVILYFSFAISADWQDVHIDMVLTDNSGNPFQPEGFYCLTFTIYEDATSTTPLWSTSQYVYVDANGHISVVLTPVGSSIFSLNPDDKGIRYLQISSCGGDLIGDRQKIASDDPNASTYKLDSDQAEISRPCRDLKLIDTLCDTVMYVGAKDADKANDLLNRVLIMDSEIRDLKAKIKELEGLKDKLK